MGLYKNITSGLNQIFKNKTKVIVLEDDIIVSSNFLNYMNSNLKIYKNENKVGSICSNNITENKKLRDFFLYHQDCWGWATWKRAWKLFNSNSGSLLKKINEKDFRKKFNLDNKYDFTNLLSQNIKKKRSWAINWYASLFLNKKLNLYSSTTMSQNIGFGSDATNSKVLLKLPNLDNIKRNYKYKKETVESKEAYKSLVNFYKNYYSSEKKSISKIGR